MHFQNKDQLHSLNISVVIDSEKYGYLNARKFPIYNTFGESTFSRVKIAAKISTPARSS